MIPRQNWNIKVHKHRHAACHVFPGCERIQYPFLAPTHKCTPFLIGWAITNTITDFCTRKWTWQNMGTPKWTCILKHACAHTPLLKADLRQYLSFNNANKHLYCFVWWMAWFMRKTSHQQYFTCRIPGDSERADCRGEEKETLQPSTRDRCPVHTASCGDKEHIQFKTC